MNNRLLPHWFGCKHTHSILTAPSSTFEECHRPYLAPAVRLDVSDGAPDLPRLALLLASRLSDWYALCDIYAWTTGVLQMFSLPKKTVEPSAGANVDHMMNTLQSQDENQVSDSSSLEPTQAHASKVLTSRCHHAIVGCLNDYCVGVQCNFPGST